MSAISKTMLSRLLIGSAMAALTLPAWAQSAGVNDTQPAVELEEIVVTGLRASLANAAMIKRNMGEVVDSITADDIGKLPDPNVAETLTRIPGVQAYRFGGEAASPVGAGSGLTIRGLSNQTAARADGRAYFTAGSREFNIESAIPGIVAGLDVYKNPSAEHIEGAIGGLVNIKTRKPLDFKDDLVMAASVAGRYNDFAKKAQPELFGLVAKQIDLENGGRLGVLLAANYQRSVNRGDNNPGNGGTSLRRAVRADSAEYTALGLNPAYAGRSDVVYLADVPNPLALPEAQRQTLISALTQTTPVNLEQYTRTRKGANASVQWQPNEEFEFTATGLYNSYLYHQEYRFLATSDSRYVRNLTTTPFTVDEAFANRNSNGGANELLAGTRLASGTFLQSGLVSTGGDEHRKYETGVIAGSAKWTPTDAFELSADLSYVKADQYQDNRSLQLVPRAGLAWDITRDLTATPHTIELAGPDLGDPANWVYNSYTNGTNQVWDDDGLAAQVDGKYTFEDSPLKALKGGLRYAYQTDRYRNYSFANRPLTTNGLALTATQSNAITVASQQDMVEKAPTSFLDGKGGYRGGFVVFTPDELLGDNVRSRFTQAGILPEDALAENLLQRRYFKEETTGGYVQGDFAFLDDRIEGNVGVRVVRTDLFVRAMVTNVPAGGGATTIIANERRTDYTNVLPAFNVTGHLTDDTLVRAGYGKGLTRPDVGALNPTIVADLNTGIGSQGNANLKPQTADSFDISLEHYFGRANYVAINPFYKKIKGFFSGVEECITVSTAPAYNGVTSNNCPTGQYRITRTVNAEKGSAKGVEIAGQTFFDYDFVPEFLHGFGASASFTYVETKNPLILNGVRTNTRQPFSSKYNYSLTGMYEDDFMQARLVYTYRSDQILFGVSANPIDGRYIKGYGLLDASVSFNVAEDLSVAFNASNLTNAAPNRYVGEPGYATGVERQHFANGRVFGASMRYSFGS
ncbi:TonB-dependent receptor [Niveispirillum sp. KHB5.9]|uniref:TonB-dependent receptor n=1 Tax=Niveispirillum sp. KHB5.9 TaxID=3400269 RepID=UPI003A8AD1D6